MNKKNTTIIAAGLLSLGILSFSLIKNPAVAQQSEKPDPIKMLTAPSDDLVNKGKELYQTNCVTCHGPQGKGDGAAAAALTPKPRDFTATSGWKNARSFAGIYKTLNDGIPGGAMAAYNYMPASDRVALTHALSSFGNIAAPNEQEAKGVIEKYNLTEELAKVEAKKEAIPVEEALKQLIKKDQKRKEAIDKRLATIEKDQAQGAKLFMKVALHPQMALVALSANPTWENSMENLVAVALANRHNNGFKARVAMLTKQEWQTLYDYLKGLN